MGLKIRLKGTVPVIYKLGVQKMKLKCSKVPWYLRK